MLLNHPLENRNLFGTSPKHAKFQPGIAKDQRRTGRPSSVGLDIGVVLVDPFETLAVDLR